MSGSEYSNNISFSTKLHEKLFSFVDWNLIKSGTHFRFVYVAINWERRKMQFEFNPKKWSAQLGISTLEHYTVYTELSFRSICCPLCFHLCRLFFPNFIAFIRLLKLSASGFAYRKCQSFFFIIIPMKLNCNKTSLDFWSHSWFN